MLKSFLLTEEAQAPAQVQLKSGGLTLGRAEDNDICIRNNSVSAHHARVVTYFEVSYIEDLGSTNGTYLNGKRIQKHTLHDGDEIWLGRCRMTFVRREPEQATDVDPHAEAEQAAG